MPTLDWIGKKAVINHHREVPYHLLRCDAKLSVGDPGSGNLLVEGDNLLALKALLPYYAGQVKCIYIDPPYNTGNEKWVYNDAVNSPEIRRWLGKVVGQEAEDLSRHDKWLSMMYPRLALLREFLRQDGVIFVSVDDTEVGSLIFLLDELFHRKNRLSTAVVRRRSSQANLKTGIAPVHDYLLIYAKDLQAVSFNKILPERFGIGEFKNPDDDPRGPWATAPCSNRGGAKYAITTPSGHTIEDEWRFKRETFESLLADNRIVFPRKGKGKPRYKVFLSEKREEGVIPSTWWDDVGSNQDAKNELLCLLGDRYVFDNPKPRGLVARILQMATDNTSLILDSFAGSATTGHAVLAANKADGGNRRFILVEMESDICRNVTAQRLTRAIEGYEANGKPIAGLGGGFRYCTLAEPLFDEAGTIRPQVTFADLAAHVFFTETGEPIPKRTNGRTPLLGVCKGTAYYLLFNGILGDKRPDGGNVLTGKTLAQLPGHDGPKVVYGEGCRLGRARLKRQRITFRQIPYEVKVS